MESITTEQGSLPLKGISILVMEDDALVSRLYEKWLTRAGARVTMANDGAQGLRLLVAEERFNIVLLDLGMPGLDGFATLDAIRGIPEIADIPVIILTNTTVKTDPEQRERLQKKGVSDILHKYETSLGDLVASVRKHTAGTDRINT